MAQPLLNDVSGLSARASRVLARGVTSFARVRDVPLVLAGAEGAHVTDVEGNRYVDLVCGMGPILLGHGEPSVLDRVREEIGNGVLFGSHPGEILLGERLVDLLPFVDKVLMANSGSEAVQAALRIARATTGRRLIVKFEGHYHGWLDPIFVNTQVVPAAPDGHGTIPPIHAVEGMTPSDEVLVCRWNDLDGFRDLMSASGSEVAAVIMEPIPLNFGTMLPQRGYVDGVRDICRAHGALLVFDEVLSGFRVALGGASELLGTEPDIAVYAKAIASGFPLAVVAGSDEAMASVVSGSVQPAGTYSGSPAAVAAALATIDLLHARRGGLYTYLDRLGAQLRVGLESIARTLKIPLVTQQVGSVLQVLWDPRLPVRSYADAARTDRALVASLCEGVLSHGVFAVPRGLLLLNAAHTAADVDRVLEAFEETARALFDGLAPATPAQGSLT